MEENRVTALENDRAFYNFDFDDTLEQIRRMFRACTYSLNGV